MKTSLPVLALLLALVAPGASAAGGPLSKKEQKTFLKKAVLYWYYRDAGAPAEKIDKVKADLEAFEGRSWKGLRDTMVKPYCAPKRFKKRKNNVELARPPADLEGCTFIVATPPGYSPRKARPLVIALHGGGRGVGSAGQIMSLLGSHYTARGCIVAAPTVPPNAVFAEAIGEKFVREIIWQVSSEYAVDYDRMYVTGHSMGGVGSWYMAVRMPDVFAAASPAAGNPSCVVDFVMLYNTPMFVVHGATDIQVKPDQDRAAAAAIKALPADKKRKGFFVYREITTGDARGHALPASVIKEMSAFMLKRKRDIIPERVICVCPFIRTTEQPVIPYARAFWLAIDGSSYKATADGRLEKGNVIRIQSSGGQRLEVFLNDDMVDLDKPVKIYVNGRLAHDKVVPRSAAFLLDHIRKSRDRGRVFANKVVLEGY